MGVVFVVDDILQINTWNGKHTERDQWRRVGVRKGPDTDNVLRVMFFISYH